MASNHNNLAVDRRRASRSLGSLVRREIGAPAQRSRPSGVVPWRSRAAARPCRPGWAAPQPVAPAQSVPHAGATGWAATLVVHIVVAAIAGCLWMAARAEPLRAMTDEPAARSIPATERKTPARLALQPRPRATQSSARRAAPQPAATPTALGHRSRAETPSAEPPPTRPTAAVIVGTVKRQGATMKPCLAQAWRRGQLESGRSYRLILDWTIEPDGRVTAPRVVGPAAMLGTPLAACFRQRMREWTFPATVEGAPVRNYPFGPFTIR